MMVVASPSLSPFHSSKSTRQEKNEDIYFDSLSINDYPEVDDDV